jgi:2-phospho-L-lactate transferase/gluconeogenesis factor (CofD/UPF0052 family)
VNHDLLPLTTILITTLGGGVGTLKLEVLVCLLEVLAAVALVENVVDDLQVEGVRDELVIGDDILVSQKPC